MRKFSLNPLASKPRPPTLDYAVFDIEAEATSPNEPLNTKFLAAGVYDGTEYTEHMTIDGLVARLLSDGLKGRTIYAHNGSGYDFIFLLEYFTVRNVRFTARRIGGRIFLTVAGRTFVDSLALLRGSLAKVADELDLGEAKRAVPDDFFTRIRHYWARFGSDYLRQDCLLLFRAIQTLQDACHIIGCELRQTIASTALDLYRRQYLPRALIPEPWNSLAEIPARHAYLGGRTEVFKREMSAGVCVDINSCYPYAMTQPVPVELERSTYNDSHLHPYSICRATVTIPKDEHVPPLCYRYNSKLFFPTGSWDSWFTSIELNRVRALYGTNAVKPHESFVYKPDTIFKDYALSLYSQRREYKDQSKPALAYVCKLLLNSLYGKFGTEREREEIKTGPQWFAYPYDDEKAAARYERYRAEGYKMRKKVYSDRYYIYGIPALLTAQAPYIFPATAAWITSHARTEQLHPLLSSVGQDLVYCDTDSCYYEGPFRHENSNELGGLKLESEIAHGRFVAPKCYHYTTPDGEIKGAAKGVRRSAVEATESELEREGQNVLLAFLNGKPVRQPRMLGAFEVLRKTGDFKPVSEVQIKQMRTVDLKRHPDGRAWSVDELATNQ